MSDDDNVVPLFSNNTAKVITINPGKTIVVIRPDGVKVRGSDRIPLAALDRNDLLLIIDELYDMIARR